MEKIGIAISTFNRPNVLDLSLAYLKDYTDSSIPIVVFDDGSKTKKENESICFKHGIEYHYNDNAGIAKNKNRCINYFKDYDHLFLLDDDVFPKKDSWINLYIQTAKRTNNHHLLYMFENKTGRDHHFKIGESEGVGIYSTCGGVVFYLDKEVISKCGGYNNSFDWYGYEHAEFSKRIHRAGLTPLGEYITPSTAYDYLCSLDYNLEIDGVVYLDVKNKKDVIDVNFTSSINTDENKLKTHQESIEKNSKIFAAVGTTALFHAYN